MKLCTCTNCGNVYEDLNPSDKSIEYNPESFVHKIIIPLPIIVLEDNTRGYGCSRCKTDAYLIDNLITS